MVSVFVVTLALMASPTTPMTSYLERALARGVPLYNSGQPVACAAVYATALEGIAGGEGWGLVEEQRTNLSYQLEATAALEDPDDQAWAFRRLIDALLAGEPLAPPPQADERLLFDLSDPAQVDRWRVVLDGVMGGLSTGEIAPGEGTLVFSGETSLRNNGGFSSIRALLPAGALLGFDALRVRVKGDGRTWILGANIDPGRRGSSFWHRFATTAGEWITVTVPLSDMARQFFGRPMEGRVRPSDVRGVEFYIFDKQAGPFRLEVERVEAVRTEAKGETTGSE